MTQACNLKPDRFGNWRAAALLGLLSSTFSTLVSQLTAARIGRDAGVDWMTVAAIPLRDLALQSDPGWGVIAAGVAFHQWADFSWALVFFGLLGRWTANLSALTIACLAMPWALVTSSLEWLLLVPLLPFWQPIFILQQPYWIGFLVHAASASMYPFFVRIRWRARRHPTDRSVLSCLGAGAAVGVVLIAVFAVLGNNGRELVWLGRSPDADQSYMRHMRTHHAQGIELAELARARARDAHLRALAALMVASQAGENGILEHWWQSWFGMAMPSCSAAERAIMPGFIDEEDMQALRDAPDGAFDDLFVRTMTRHHLGAARMADDELRNGSDPRLRIMAHAIRHAQLGEIALMRGASGMQAVRLAVRHMLMVGEPPETVLAP